MKTIAVPDFETAEDIPEFVECDGWYSICRCGQHDAWSLTKLTKLMRGREKTLLNLTQAYSAGSSSSGVPLRECDFCGQNPSNHPGKNCPDKSLYKDRIEARRVRYLRAFSDGSETPVNVTDIVFWPGHKTPNDAFQFTQRVLVDGEDNLSWEEKEKLRFYREQGDKFVQWYRQYTEKVVVPVIPLIPEETTSRNFEPPIRVSLSERIPPPIQHAAPTMSPLNASVPKDYGPISDVDSLTLRVSVETLEDVVRRAGYSDGREVSQAIRELKRLAEVNIKARQENAYKTDFVTWTSVNKDFYPSVTSRNEAWKLQKRARDILLGSTKRRILDDILDIYTAPIEHLRLLPIPPDVVSELIQFRTQRPFRTTRVLSSIHGVVPKIFKKILSGIKPLTDQVVDPLGGGSPYMHPEVPTPLPQEPNVLG